MMTYPPYDRDDMNAAVKYAAKIRRVYREGDIKKAYKMFLNDPNGTGVSMEKFIEGMEKIV